MIKVSSYERITRFDLARTLAGRGRYWTTAYLVDHMMVDTGCFFTTPELIQQLAKQPVSKILNTHTHEDHIGADGVLQRQFPELEILAHPLALPILADPVHKQPLHPYRRIYWGWPDPSLARAVVDGEIIHTDHYNFQVIYTPGHSPDHLSLYEPQQGWLFTGDLYVGGQDRALRDGSNIWEIIASLKKVVLLPLTKLFPGCARIRDNPVEELTIKINYLEALGEQVLNLHSKGYSVSQIVHTLCGRPMTIEFVTLGNFSRRHLVLSYLDIPEDRLNGNDANPT